MKTRLESFWAGLLSTYWFVPAVMCAGAFVLSETVLYLDDLFTNDGDEAKWLGWTYGGSTDAAREVLSTVASSMITVAGVSFSIVIVALTLASQQFGPGLLGNFMRDRGNQFVLGTFTATFLYSLLVLRKIYGDSIPQLAISVCIILAVAGIGVLIYFIHHIASSIHVSSMVDRVGRELDGVVDRLYPEEIGQSVGRLESCRPGFPRGEHAVVRSVRTGYVEGVDAEGLLRTAIDSDLVVRLRCHPGQFITEGQVLVELWPAERFTLSLGRKLQGLVLISTYRTPWQDLEFAVQQLLEIALRALSPSVNDPFTAVLCTDRLMAAFIRLSGRKIPPAQRFDDAGNLRVITLRADYYDIVAAAFRRIERAADQHPEVVARVRLAVARVADHAAADEMRQALAYS